ncbi:FtsW/RodA/SpoVE family cell cycle protein [Clostridium botulinum]|nr:FtsW/RodA/SpoVE family cell cycle protein [Clostridium botulinum]NFS55538.1 FtsW/RodA/SpoVE family cell cycle protein [Clostridium botulinum]NFT18066.1 FtsW/RodA/SpoVE family cell cycle protein [Clostridium botulinum]
MNIKDSDDIKKYINDVCSQVKNKRMHNEIRDELSAHLEEKTNEYIKSGEKKEKALKKAINEMGSSKHVGSELNMLHKSKPEWSIIALSIGLVLFSAVIIRFFEWNVELENNHISKNNIIFNILAIFVFIMSCFIDYREIKKYSKYIYTIGLFSLAYTVFSGIQGVNGVKQWLPIGGLTINIGYFVPIIIVIALAGIYDKYDWTNKRKIIIALFLGLLPLGLLVRTNSLFSFIIYGISLIILVYLSKPSKRILGLFISIETLIMILSKIGFDTISNFVNRSNNIDGYGYIYNQLKIIRDSSVLIGRATNFDKNIIPEFYIDYILSYIIYNFGWIVGIIIITLIGVLIIRMIKVAICVKNTYAKSLVLGVVSIITIQFICNVLMTFGITISVHSPMPLPFISYGGTSTIINMFIVGIIINVYKGKNISKVEKI